MSAGLRPFSQTGPEEFAERPVGLKSPVALLGPAGRGVTEILGLTGKKRIFPIDIEDRMSILTMSLFRHFVLVRRTAPFCSPSSVLQNTSIRPVTRPFEDWPPTTKSAQVFVAMRFETFHVSLSELAHAANL